MCFREQEKGRHQSNEETVLSRSSCTIIIGRFLAYSHDLSGGHLWEKFHFRKLYSNVYGTFSFKTESPPI